LIAPEPNHDPTAPVSCLPCWTTTATIGGAEFNGPATASTPPATAAVVATLKTACDVVPEWACTIATSAWPRSRASTS
jgi:hypothetical protein